MFVEGEDKSPWNLIHAVRALSTGSAGLALLRFLAPIPEQARIDDQNRP